MRVLEVEQNTDEWRRARAGKFTASSCADLLARGRGGRPSASRGNLISQIACERILGEPMRRYASREMDRGHELEEGARQAYERMRSVLVEEVGFCLHARLDHVGCSPDALVGRDGLAQFKCPEAPDRHASYLTTPSDLADEYGDQEQFELWVTGRQWADIVSYDPRWPEGLRVAVHRLRRDESRIMEIATAVENAERQVKSRIKFLEKLRSENAAP